MTFVRRSRVHGTILGRLSSGRSVEAERVRDLIAEIAELDGAARLEAMRYLTHAGDLGLDHTDPDIIERSLEAGRAMAHRTHAGASRHLDKLPIAAGGLHMPVVYYMRIDNHVKIGTTGNLPLRVATIAPQGVMAVEPGSFETEYRRHKQFVDIRKQGEWFLLTGELAAHICVVREQFEVVFGVSTEQWIDAQSDAARHGQRRHDLRLDV